ncbi:MAG TPA: GntR family transcriptional regulator [Candidatus Binataceae bacterium]|nr:GntR family transcriptional regulator [Candidatus Binataceae bacterium]
MASRKNSKPTRRGAGDPETAGRWAAVEMVAETIRRRIQNGRYASGRRLIEADLTGELGVSRGPVREALRRLAAEGMLELVPNRGARVPGLSAAGVEELLAVLEPLVVAGAEAAARRASQPEIKRRLRAALIATRAFERRTRGKLTVADCMDENGRFHEALAALSGNRLLAKLVSQLQVNMFRLAYHNPRIPADPERWTFNHGAILEAVIAGEARRAGGLMREFCRRIGPALIELSHPEPAQRAGV